MITIHIVLQYYDVIARDLPLIGVIVGKLVDYKRLQEQSQHVHWNRVKIAPILV